MALPQRRVNKGGRSRENSKIIQEATGSPNSRNKKANLKTKTKEIATSTSLKGADIPTLPGKGKWESPAVLTAEFCSLEIKAGLWLTVLLQRRNPLWASPTPWIQATTTTSARCHLALGAKRGATVCFTRQKIVSSVSYSISPASIIATSPSPTHFPCRNYRMSPPQPKAFWGCSCWYKVSASRGQIQAVPHNSGNTLPAFWISSTTYTDPAITREGLPSWCLWKCGCWYKRPWNHPGLSLGNRGKVLFMFCSSRTVANATSLIPTRVCPAWSRDIPIHVIQTFPTMSFQDHRFQSHKPYHHLCLAHGT